MAEQESLPAPSDAPDSTETASAPSAAEAAAASDPDFARAREQFAAVLALAGIDRVVFVDDANADQGRSIEDVVRALEAGTLSVDDLAHVPDLRAILTEDDELVDERRAADLLGSAHLDPAVQQAAVQGFADHQTAHVGTPDQSAISIVRDLLSSSSVSYQTETLSSWPSVLQSIIADARHMGTAPSETESASTGGTLVLFDRDFSNEPGGRQDDGEVQVAELIRATRQLHGIYVALVTHQVQPEDEEQQRVEVAKRQSVPDETFVLISKAWFTNDQLGFADRVQRIIGWTAAMKLTSLVVGVISAHYQESAAQLALLSPGELFRVLVHQAQADGVWEPDQVQRLLRAHLDGELAASLRSNDDAWELASLVRGASPAEFAAPPAFGTSDVRRLQRNEYYTSATVLNLGVGIETGDIFRVVSPSATPAGWDQARTSHDYFIVVEQNCNVALRRGGRRSPEVPLTVAMIEFPAKVSRGGHATGVSDYRLPMFCPITGQDAEVKLGRRKSIPWEAIDPTVWGAEGGSVIPIDGTSGPGKRLDDRWTERFVIAVARAAAIRAEFHSLVEDAVLHPKAITTLLQGILGTSSFVRVELSETHLRFGVQRVSRLREPFATELRVNSGAYQARLAFEAPLMDAAEDEPVEGGSGSGERDGSPLREPARTVEAAAAVNPGPATAEPQAGDHDSPR